MNIKSILSKIRWHGMAYGKIPLICTIIFYLIYKNNIVANQAVQEFFLFLLFSLVSGIFGYLVNDLFDIEIDFKHGKKNIFGRIGFWKGSLIVIFTLLVSLVIGYRFINREYFFIIWIVWIFLATFYSAKPLRLKERSLFGLIANTLSQYSIPILLCFSAFGDFSGLEYLLIVLFVTIGGFTQELGHQRVDYPNDIKTNTNTFAVNIGRSKSDKLYQFFVYMDIISIFMIIITMGSNIGSITIMDMEVNVFLPIILIDFYLVIVVLFKLYKNKKELIDPYYKIGRKDIINIAYVLFPNFLMPFALSLLLLSLDYIFLVFVLFIIVYTKMSFPNADFVRPIKVIMQDFKRFL